MSTLPLAVLAAEETGHALPMPPYAFGLIALAVVVLLLVVVWLFRHTAQALIEGQHPHGFGDAHHGHADVHRDTPGGAGH